MQGWSLCREVKLDGALFLEVPIYICIALQQEDITFATDFQYSKTVMIHTELILLSLHVSP